jgi:hypothetical protein
MSNEMWDFRGSSPLPEWKDLHFVQGQNDKNDVSGLSKKKGTADGERHWWYFITAVPLHLGRNYSKTELFGQPLIERSSIG